MATSRRDSWDWRVQITLAIGIVVAVGMVLLGMQPRLVLVAFVVMVTAGATWLVLDVSHVAAPIMWQDYGTNEPGATRPDHRVRALRSRLERSARTRRSATSDIQAFDEIVGTLVDVIDDHLLAEHGVDRPSDPVRAAALLGTELDRFVNDAAAQRSMTQRRALPRTVSLIEDLVRAAQPSNP